MKNRENFLANKKFNKNNVVTIDSHHGSDKKPSQAITLHNRPGQVIPWPVSKHMNYEEKPTMETPSPDTRLQMLESAPMGIVITDGAGLILWCNETMAKWAGDSSANCVGRTESGVLNFGTSASVPSNSGPYKLGDGEKERWVMRCAQPDAGDQQTIYYMDVTEEEHLRQERTQLAKLLDQHNTVDPISGLLNHRGIVKGLEPLVSRSRRYENPLSVVTMTVTNLPDIEKSYGHTAVDKMVIVISQLLRDQLRWADLVGRDDTGDFVFVLPETDQNAAILLANKIADQLNGMNVSVDESNSSKPQACFGVVSWTRGDDSTQLLNRSNNAAATASQQGAFSVEAA